MWIPVPITTLMDSDVDTTKSIWDGSIAECALCGFLGYGLHG